MGVPAPASLSMKAITKWRQFSLCAARREGKTVALVAKGVPTRDATFAMFSYETKDGQPYLEATTWNSAHVRIVTHHRIAEWDPELVRAAVVCTAAACFFDLNTGSHVDNSQWILDAVQAARMSHENLSFNTSPCRALRDAQYALGEAYGEFMDLSYKAAVSSVRDVFRKYQARLTEEEVLRWFREATVEHVLSE